MKSPVLLLAFNRADTTSQVFTAIQQAKPPRLYVAVDGPRKDHKGEAALVAEVQKIATQVDWPCKVTTLFRSKNLGCKYAVSSAIEWFFTHEEQGIILEDDTVPSEAFFGFCDLMLDKYKNDLRVWMICGFNPRGANCNSDAYFFSENPAIWGWACWSDRWKRYDVEMSSWPSKELLFYLKQKFPFNVRKYYIGSFNRTQKKLINTWDYQFTYLILQMNGLVIKPYANLVSNIGIDGTHVKCEDINHFVPYGKINISNMVHPKFFIQGIDQDYWFYKNRMPSSIKMASSYITKHLPIKFKTWLKKVF